MNGKQFSLLVKLVVAYLGWVYFCFVLPSVSLFLHEQMEIWQNRLRLVKKARFRNNKDLNSPNLGY